jgi:hypothetical protein
MSKKNSSIFLILSCLLQNLSISGNAPEINDSLNIFEIIGFNGFDYDYLKTLIMPNGNNDDERLPMVFTILSMGHIRNRLAYHTEEPLFICFTENKNNIASMYKDIKNFYDKYGAKYYKEISNHESNREHNQKSFSLFEKAIKDEQAFKDYLNKDKKFRDLGAEFWHVIQK